MDFILNQYFSAAQIKMLGKLKLFVPFVLILAVIRYIIYEFTPDTETYIVLWRLSNAVLLAFFFAWIFYSNKKWIMGLIINLLFIPFYGFKNRISNYIDYYTNLPNSDVIFDCVLWGSLILPAVVFTIFHLKLNKIKVGFLNFIAHVGLIVAAMLVMGVDVSNITQLVNISFDSEVVEYLFAFIFIILGVLKLIAFQFGLFYLLNRVGSWKKLVEQPISKHFISQRFFSVGFFVSFTIIFSLFFGSLKDFLGLIVDLFSTDGISLFKTLRFISLVLFMILSARFLGFLIEYRGDSVKRYFGIFGSISLFPLINFISFLVMRRKNNNKLEVKEFLKKAEQLRIFHVVIYCLLIVGFMAFRASPDFEDTTQLAIEILIAVACIVLVSFVKKSAWIAPAIVTGYFIVTQYNGFKVYNDFSEIFGFSLVRHFLFIILIYFAYYYTLYFVYHKAFYTDSSLENQKEIEANFN